MRGQTHSQTHSQTHGQTHSQASLNPQKTHFQRVFLWRLKNPREGMHLFPILVISVLIPLHL